MQINSVAADGIKRSSGSKLNIFPMNDFLETQIQIGFENLFNFFRFDITSISRIYHGKSVIFVKNGFFPFGLKKPIAGSIIILSAAIEALFAIDILSVRTFMVPKTFPETRADRPPLPP